MYAGVVVSLGVGVCVWLCVVCVCVSLCNECVK